MGGTDRFKSSDEGLPEAKAKSFASDAFVRSATQPLTKKSTKSLALTPEALQQQLAGIEEQIQICQKILVRFAPRMRLLKAVSDPPPPPSKKLGLFKMPTSHSDLALSAPEQQAVASIAQRMKSNPELARRITIALVQFMDAENHVANAFAKLNEIRGMDPAKAFAYLETLEVSKLLGRVYPLSNFHEAFKDDELLRQIFPPPVSTASRSPEKS